MTSSNRVYIYGVTPDGEKEFMETVLDLKGARSSCAKYLRMFPERFNCMKYGTAIQLHDGGMLTFCKGDFL